MLSFLVRNIVLKTQYHLNVLILSLFVRCLEQRIIFSFTNAVLAVSIPVLISVVWWFSVNQVLRYFYFWTLSICLPSKVMFKCMFGFLVLPYIQSLLCSFLCHTVQKFKFSSKLYANFILFIPFPCIIILSFSDSTASKISSLYMLKCREDNTSLSYSSRYFYFWALFIVHYFAHWCQSRFVIVLKSLLSIYFLLKILISFSCLTISKAFSKSKYRHAYPY